MGVAAASIGEELFINTGFETVADGGAADFGAYGGWGGEYVSLTSEAANVYRGNNAVKFVTTAGGNPYIGQMVSNLPGDGIRYKYKIGFWFKGTVKDDSGFTVKIEQYGPSGHVGDQWAHVQGSARKWVYYEYEFYAHPYANRMTVMPRLMSQNATVFIDDISFKLTGGPEQFNLDTDWVFYYQEYRQATATLTMNDFYEDIGYTVDFELTKDGQPVFSEGGLTFTDNRLIYKFDISSLEKKTEYLAPHRIWWREKIYPQEIPEQAGCSGIFVNPSTA